MLHKKERARINKFYQDVNTELCREHFAVIKGQAGKIDRQARIIDKLIKQLAYHSSSTEAEWREWLERGCGE